eukprot:scaffold3076_cov117-Isochrysis_galbana.AAC.2
MACERERHRSRCLSQRVLLEQQVLAGKVHGHDSGAAKHASQTASAAHLCCRLLDNLWDRGGVQHTLYLQLDEQRCLQWRSCFELRVLSLRCAAAASRCPLLGCALRASDAAGEACCDCSTCRPPSHWLPTGSARRATEQPSNRAGRQYPGQVSSGPSVHLGLESPARLRHPRRSQRHKVK